MNSNDSLRNRLKAGHPIVGTWLQLPGPDTAEIIGHLGYDWAAVDLEHGALTCSDLPNIFRALELGGTQPFARVLEVSRAQIKGALESGARGIIFPMIESREQLDFAIEEALYPGGWEFAHGARGVGYCRANGYGRDLDIHLHPEASPARDIVLVAQIEHVRAVKNLEAIFSHPRLDAYMIGPYDLSASLGRAGDFANPDFKAALAAVAEAAARHGLAQGIHVVQPNPEELEMRFKEGYTFLAYGIDAVFLIASGSNPFKVKP